MEHLFRTYTKKINWELDKPLNIWFWGDVHYDSDACDRDRFAWFLERSGKCPDSYFFCLGDVHDFASAREQVALLKADLHETTLEHFDDIVTKKNIHFAELIKPMRGKLLGMVGGNHTWKLQNGKYSDEDLAERMEAPYLGWLCVYAITFDFGSNMSRTIYIVACHGQGGGKLIGTSINKLDDLKRIFPFADIFVSGHDHQRGGWPTTVLQPVLCNGKLKLKQQRQYLVKSGSFLKAYENDKNQYTTKSLYRPSDLGAVKVAVSFHRNNKNRTTEIITDIESTV